MATFHTSVRDEARLLFLCAGPRETDAAIAGLARGTLDWGHVAQLAMAARAVPVVATRVAHALGGGLPAAAAGLGRLAMVEEFELTRMEERLDETVAAFEAAGIRAVLLKGAALARSVYASVADRPMLDLDVLVPADGTDAARAAALSAGWVWKHDVRYAPFYSTHHHLPPLRDGRGTRALLELHTGLFPGGHPFQLKVDDVVARAVRIDRRGPAVLIPSAEDHLVYLCGHWVWSHMMNGGAWRALRDVGALAERGGLDWDRAVAQTRSALATTCVYWTLRLARRLAGVRVPDAVLSTLEPPTPAFARDRLERYFVWQLGGARSCPSVRLGRMLWSAALRPRWSAHGRGRPWDNPESAIWLADKPAMRESAARRLAASLGLARALVRA